MSSDHVGESVQRQARIAGYLYLMLGVVAPIRLMYIRGVVTVAGDPQATAANIVAHQTLFRAGLLTDVLAGVLALLTGFALYRLFRETDRDLAAIMFILGGPVVAAVYFFNVVIDAGTLVTALAPPYLSVFDVQQRGGLVGLFLRLHGYATTVNEMLWGLWLVPMGMLILQSRLVPRFVAYWLFFNAAAYVLECVLGLLSPRLDAAVSPLLFPALLAEVIVMIWLAFGRVDPRPISA